MTDSPRKIGHYDVIREIGRGGMGVVYLAFDTKLDRQVAVKALPDDVAADPERLDRFQREATLLASLSHPNIAAVYGLEESDGHKYIVLEYVEGDDLSTRVENGAMPLDEAMETAAQIAAGLEAAHAKGVIHRDLKPANIKVSTDGAVKVLDFGLAKVVGEVSSSVTKMADSPTVQAAASPTMPGVILGTAGYMSPEQARGRSVDKRSDVFSFGCVLYEMLSGSSPFPGENVTDSIGATLHVEPDFGRLPPTTPVEVRHLVQRCLVKDRRRRLHDIADARIELEDVGQKIASGIIESVAQVDTGRGRAGWLWPVASGVLCVALIGVLVRGRFMSPPAGADNTGPTVIGIEQVTDQPGLQFDPNLSPDGRQLLYIGLDGDDWDIFLHRVGGENPINLTADSPGDEYCPVFSPDGERIAFYSSREGGGIFVMGATGESPRRVTHAGFDPAWSPDGRRIVYSTERGNDAYGRGTTAALSVVEIKTGETRELFAGDAVDPSWSPDGKRIAFWSATGGLRDIWTIAADGGDPLAVTQDHHTDWNPLWSADGRYLYFISDRGGSPDLWRFQIDQGSGRTLGEPEAVTVGISAVWQASLSADGRRVAFATRDLSSEIVRIGFDSENERPVGDPTVVYATSKALNNIDVSPDGQWLAMATRAPREDIYVMRLDGTGRRRLTDDPDRDRGPNWSADGDWLTWYSNRGGSYEVWVVRRDGTYAHPLTETPGRDLFQPLWAPDERRLAVSFSRNQSSWTILVDVERPFAEIREPLPLVGTEIKNFVATSWSPGGRWLVGGGYGPAGEDVGVLHDLQTGESLLLQSSETAYHDWDGSAAWLDEGRFLFGDRRLGGVHVWDVAEGTSREVIGVPGPGVIRVIDDGRALIINRSRDESDIWMLRLGE